MQERTQYDGAPHMLGTPLQATVLNSDTKEAEQ